MTTPQDPWDSGDQPDGEPRRGRASAAGLVPRSGYPPPPPPGYPPAPPAGYPGPGYPSPQPGMDPYAQASRPNYASWGTRVGAYLLDVLVTAPPYVLGIILGSAVGGSGGGVIIAIGALGTLGIAIWNRWLRAGRTGQSLGKVWTNTYLVDEQTGQPLGAGGALLRDLLHILDGICYIGYILAAFDAKTQTFADKIKGSIVVRG